MFIKAASLYWQLKAQVGHGATVKQTKLYGLGCRISAHHVLTAAHVVDGANTRVLLGDGLWHCEVARDWREYDLAVLRVTSVAKQMGPSEKQPGSYPHIATRPPSIGASLGYLAWLTLKDQLGDSSGHTYFGQGHVALFTQNEHGQLVFALAGGAVQKGFSGGPVFDATGLLSGVIVQALEYVPDLRHPARAANVVAILAPVAPISKELAGILDDDP